MMMIKNELGTLRFGSPVQIHFLERYILLIAFLFLINSAFLKAGDANYIFIFNGDNNLDGVVYQDALKLGSNLSLQQDGINLFHTSLNSHQSKIWIHGTTLHTQIKLNFCHLNEFIHRSLSNEKKNFIFLSSHGFGFRGIGPFCSGDLFNPSPAILSIHELVQMIHHEDFQKIDYLIFDACGMSTIEILMDLAQVAQHVITFPGKIGVQKIDYSLNFTSQEEVLKNLVSAGFIIFNTDQVISEINQFFKFDFNWNEFKKILNFTFLNHSMTPLLDLIPVAELSENPFPSLKKLMFSNITQDFTDPLIVQTFAQTKWYAWIEKYKALKDL